MSKGHDLRDGQFTGVHKDRAQHHIGGINQELALVLHRAGHFHIFIDIEAARSLVHQIALQDAAGSVHVDLAAVGDIAGNRILGLNMERGALRQIDIRGNSQGPQFSGNGYGTTLDIQLLKYETVAVAAEFGFASHIGQADRSFLGSGQIQFRIVGEISEILGTGNQYFRPKFRGTSAGLVQTVDDLIELVSGSAGNAQQRIVLIVERAEEFILGTDHIETGFRNMCCRPAVLITGGAAAGIQYIVLDSDFVRNQIERSSVDRIAGALRMNSLRRDRRRRITIQRQQVGIPADGSFPAITGTPGSPGIERRVLDIVETGHCAGFHIDGGNAECSIIIKSRVIGENDIAAGFEVHRGAHFGIRRIQVGPIILTIKINFQIAISSLVGTGTGPVSAPGTHPVPQITAECDIAAFHGEIGIAVGVIGRGHIHIAAERNL